MIMCGNKRHEIMDNKKNGNGIKESMKRGYGICVLAFSKKAKTQDRC